MYKEISLHPTVGQRAFVCIHIEVASKTTWWILIHTILGWIKLDPRHLKVYCSPFSVDIVTQCPLWMLFEPTWRLTTTLYSSYHQLTTCGKLIWCVLSVRQGYLSLYRWYNSWLYQDFTVFTSELNACFGSTNTTATRTRTWRLPNRRHRSSNEVTQWYWQKVLAHVLHTRPLHYYTLQYNNIVRVYQYLKQSLSLLYYKYIHMYLSIRKYIYVEYTGILWKWHEM